MRWDEGSIQPLLFTSARSWSRAPTWSHGPEGFRWPISTCEGRPVRPITRNAERQNPPSGISRVVIGRSTGANRVNFRSVAMAGPTRYRPSTLLTHGRPWRRRGDVELFRHALREPSSPSGSYAGQPMARNLYFIGTAGSGKSTMVYAFQLWMNSQGLDCVTVNLDPGAEALQYSPDLDVRDYVDLREVMEEEDLGPNGAQVAAADMIAMNAKELANVLETFETNYILIDTPGQIELFTFRASGPVLIDAFGRDDSALVYLNDPALVRSASGFVSSVLFSATVQFRHGLPFINVLSKSDILPEEDLERIVKWSLDPFALYEALFADGATARTWRRARRRGLEEPFEDGQEARVVGPEGIEHRARGHSLQAGLVDRADCPVDRCVIESDQAFLDEVVTGQLLFEPCSPSFFVDRESFFRDIARRHRIGGDLPRELAGQAAVQDAPARQGVD